jgi:ectoine hydroxylase-related dioxygenase (phytanoyl-CoA dioxygenase family)
MPDRRALSSYRTSGWAVLRKVLTPQLRESAAGWLREAAARAEGEPRLEPEFEPRALDGRRAVRKLRRLLWNDLPFWTDWLRRAGIFKLGGAFVGDDPAVVFHAAFLKPRAVGSRVALHQDQALWGNDYPDAVSVWIALSDSGERNGCIQLCPGSHLLGLIPHRDDPEYPWHPCLDPERDGLPAPQNVPTSAGDVLAWHRYTVHGSGPNLTQEDRVGMVVVFANASAPNFKARDLFRVRTQRGAPLHHGGD